MQLFVILCLSLLVFYVILICPRFRMRDRTSLFKHTMFAHRGYHCPEQGVPENSMSAFSAAIEKGYGIELDVHLTKDAHLVVFHDDNLERICGISGAVEDFTYSKLRTYTLLGTGEKIPLFTDVLSFVDGRVPLLIELKIPRHSVDICPILYHALADYRGFFMVQSFNTMGIRWFRKNAPEVLRGQLASNLIKKETSEPLILRFFVMHLLVNFLGRPDFISYKLSDLPRISIFVLRYLLGTPVAVWTLRTESALKHGISEYDMQIFEKQSENY